MRKPVESLALHLKAPGYITGKLREAQTELCEYPRCTQNSPTCQQCYALDVAIAIIKDATTKNDVELARQNNNQQETEATHANTDPTQTH